MEIVVLFTMVIGLMLIGVPIAISLGLSSILFLLRFSSTSLASIAQTLYQAMEGHATLLAIAGVFACMLFAALSGSSPATVVAIGSIVIAAMRLGVEPIHLGIIMVVNMEIGMITPRVGLNLFVTSGVAGMPIMRVVRAFLAVLFVFLIMVTYIPILSTWLPTSIMGPETIIN